VLLFVLLWAILPPVRPPLAPAVFFVHTQAMLEDYATMVEFDKMVVKLEPGRTGLLVTFLDGDMMLIPNAMLGPCSQTVH